LKKRTGIANWNTLCRWSFCLSLADETLVRDRNERNVGAVEMSWRTFATDEEAIYRFLLVERCQQEHGKTDKELLGCTLRQHISRGAARLAAAGGVKSVAELVKLAERPRRKVA
jgi:DNA sulfur modification protein DndE